MQEQSRNKMFNSIEYLTPIQSEQHLIRFDNELILNEYSITMIEISLIRRLLHSYHFRAT